MPETDWEDAGFIEAGRMVEIVVKYLKEYWDWTLLGKKEDKLLKKESATYPEVSFMDLSGSAITGQEFLRVQPQIQT